MPTSVKLSVKKFYIFLNRLLMALVINCPQACNYIQQKISVNIFFFMEFFINIPAPHQPNNLSTNHHSGEQPSSHVILSEQSEREDLSLDHNNSPANHNSGKLDEPKLFGQLSGGQQENNQSPGQSANLADPCQKSEKSTYNCHCRQPQPIIPSPPEGEGGRSPDEGCKKPSISDQHKPTDNQSPGIVKGEALDAIQGGRAGNLADPCQKSEKSIYNCHCRQPQPIIPSLPNCHCEEPQATRQSQPASLQTNNTPTNLHSGEPDGPQISGGLSSSPAEGAKIPLILYKFQLDFIKNLLHKIDSNSPLLVEKSKQMGTTTCTVLTFLWYWLFKPNSDFLIMTPFKKSLYNKNDPSTAFGLLLFVLQHLPKCFLPDKGFLFQQNRHRQYYCYLENLNNGNRIYGISAAKKRTLNQLHTSFKAILLDELAFHNNADYHWQQLASLSKCLIAVSCPNGSTNLFAELITTNFAPICRLHWALHPLCDKHWYESLIAHADPIFVEQFVNISYTLRPVRKKIQKAAFKIAETVTSIVEKKVVAKHKYSPNVSCLSNEKRKRHKNNLDVVTAPSFDMVKKRLTMNLTKTINMPVFTKRYGRDDLVECWTNVSLITDFKTPLSMNTATTAVEIVNRFSKVNIADFKAIEEDSVVNYYVGYAISTTPSPLEGEGGRSPDEGYKNHSTNHNSRKLDEPKVFGQLSDGQQERSWMGIPAHHPSYGDPTPNSYSNYTFDPLVLTTKKIVIIPDYFDDLFPPVRENPLRKARREQLEREREFEERLKHMTLEEVIAEYNKLMPDWPVYYVDGMITHYPPTTIPSTAANPGEQPSSHVILNEQSEREDLSLDHNNPSANNNSGKLDEPKVFGQLSGDQQENNQSPEQAGNLADPCQNSNKPKNNQPQKGVADSKNSNTNRFHPRTTRWNIKFLPPKRPPPDSS